jgi:hypothetical protein
MGRLLPVGTVVFVALVTTSLILLTDDGTGWAALGMLLFGFMATGVVLVAYLIGGYVLRYKQQTPFSQGLVQGTWAMIAAVILLVVGAGILSSLSL